MSVWLLFNVVHILLSLKVPFSVSRWCSNTHTTNVLSWPTRSTSIWFRPKTSVMTKWFLVRIWKSWACYYAESEIYTLAQGFNEAAMSSCWQKYDCLFRTATLEWKACHHDEERDTMIEGWHCSLWVHFQSHMIYLLSEALSTKKSLFWSET